MSLKKQSTDSHISKGVKKNKSCKNGKFTESLDYVYYCVFFEFMTVKELSTERYFIVWTAKLNQRVYYKGLLTSKFESKDMLFWNRDSSLVSTEDENLWNPCRPIWFHGTRPPERLL